MDLPKKRRRLRTEGNEASDDAIAAALPLNDLYKPGPTDSTDNDPDCEHRPASQAAHGAGSGSRSLFVRGLGVETTSESLTEFFSQSFLLKHATVVLDENKKCRGYGFVSLADPEDTTRVRETLHGAYFSGKRIQVEVAEPRHRVVEESDGPKRSRPAPEAIEARERRLQDRRAKGRTAATPKLIVRNLPFSFTQPEQLEVLFRSYGKIKNVTLPKTPAGKPAGFGFVKIRGQKNAERALVKVNGKEVDGRTLAVDWAVEKEVWEAQSRNGKGELREGSVDVPINEMAGSGSVSESGDEGMTPDDNVEVTLNWEDDKESAADDLESVHAEEDKTGTVFIRNLPFSVGDEDLYEHFRTFGPLRYARVVFDSSTGYSRGSGFVCFHRKADAIQCCRDAPKDIRGDAAKGGARSKGKQSLLENSLADADGRYTIEGRVLNVTRAVDKNEATRLTNVGKDLRNERERDKRRLYLLSEGTISSGSPLYNALTPAERKMREESVKQRQALIKGNPSLHLSLTRLSVRNIPRYITSKDLKRLAREAVVSFAADVKAGQRAALSKEELARGGDSMKEAERARKLKGKGIVSQAKVVFESKDGSKVPEKGTAGRSRGYGFIEYATHRSALMGLRFLNGHRVAPPTSAGIGNEADQIHPADALDKPKRLIVEFAIENAQVVARRRDREERSRGRTSRADSTGASDRIVRMKRASGQTSDNVSESASTRMMKGKGKGIKRKHSVEDAVVEQPPTGVPVEEGTADAAQEDKGHHHNRIIGRKRAKRRRAKAA